MTELHQISVTFSEGQKRKLSMAYRNREEISLRLRKNVLRVNVSKYQRKIKKSRSRAKNRFRSFFVYSKFKVLKKVKWQ